MVNPVPRIGILANAKTPLVAAPAPLPCQRPDRPRRTAFAVLTLGVLLMAGTIVYRFLPVHSHPGQSPTPDEPDVAVLAPPAAQAGATADVIDPAEAVYLGWQLDRPFRQEWKCQTQQRIKTGGQVSDVSYRSQFRSTWTPLPRPLSYRYLQQRIDHAQLHMKNGFQSLDFDSAGEDRGTAIAGVLRSARVGFEIRPDGQIGRVDDAEELLDGIEEAAPELLPVFEPCLNADAQKHLAEGVLAALPERTLKPGESWSRSKRLPPMLGGRLVGEHRYTFAGRDGRLVRIEVKADLVFQADQGAESAVSAAKLQGHVSGTIWFDPAKARIARSEIERHIEGKASLRAEDGGTTSVEIANRQKAQVLIEDGP
ncbi:MAG: hypothetical protein FJ271_10915 [Planctomycetes bacterium]|nr:hypothetical protein [Planctomycetota bacterium]